MSICYCDRHDRYWDSDFLDDCPKCETATQCQRCEQERENLEDGICQTCRDELRRCGPDFDPHEDDETNDPRHGQAKYINRDNRR